MSRITGIKWFNNSKGYGLLEQLLIGHLRSLQRHPGRRLQDPRRGREVEFSDAAQRPQLKSNQSLVSRLAYSAATDRFRSWARRRG